MARETFWFFSVFLIAVVNVNFIAALLEQVLVNEDVELKKLMTLFNMFDEMIQPTPIKKEEAGSSKRRKVDEPEEGEIQIVYYGDEEVDEQREKLSYPQLFVFLFFKYTMLCEAIHFAIGNVRYVPLNESRDRVECSLLAEFFLDVGRRIPHDAVIDVLRDKIENDYPTRKLYKDRMVNINSILKELTVNFNYLQEDLLQINNKEFLEGIREKNIRDKSFDFRKSYKSALNIFFTWLIFRDNTIYFSDNIKTRNPINMEVLYDAIQIHDLKDVFDENEGKKTRISAMLRYMEIRRGIALELFKRKDTDKIKSFEKGGPPFTEIEIVDDKRKRPHLCFGV